MFPTWTTVWDNGQYTKIKALEGSSIAASVFAAILYFQSCLNSWAEHDPTRDSLPKSLKHSYFALCTYSAASFAQRVQCIANIS
jgi:hypothetical protein